MAVIAWKLCANSSEA
ncbi:S-adenosyl-L-methionine-dependent methyltransferase superfamily protein [Zea mays]|nr:S-adenosyl-L-methionine-dependent methyltransferase superfamily protein [Zea mays]